MLTFPLLLQTTPCSFLHFKEGPQYDKPQANGPDYWTARPNYGLPDASSDCFETRKECNTLTTSLLITHAKLRAQSMWCPQTPHVGGSALEVVACCVLLLAHWGLKPFSYFLQALSLYLFIPHQWAEKVRILVVIWAPTYWNQRVWGWLYGTRRRWWRVRISAGGNGGHREENQDMLCYERQVRSFYGGGVSVGSERALRKKSLPLAQVSPAASREVRNGEGEWFNDPEMSLPRCCVSFWHSYFLFWYLATNCT